MQVSHSLQIFGNDGFNCSYFGNSETLKAVSNEGGSSCWKKLLSLSLSQPKIVTDFQRPNVQIAPLPQSGVRP